MKEKFNAAVCPFCLATGRVYQYGFNCSGAAIAGWPLPCEHGVMFYRLSQMRNHYAEKK